MVHKFNSHSPLAQPALAPADAGPAPEKREISSTHHHVLINFSKPPSNTNDIEHWSAFLGPEAMFLPPDRGALNTHGAIRQYYLETFVDPYFTPHCRQHSNEIANSLGLQKAVTPLLQALTAKKLVARSSG